MGAHRFYSAKQSRGTIWLFTSAPRHRLADWNLFLIPSQMPRRTGGTRGLATHGGLAAPHVFRHFWHPPLSTWGMIVTGILWFRHRVLCGK